MVNTVCLSGCPYVCLQVLVPCLIVFYNIKYKNVWKFYATILTLIFFIFLSTHSYIETWKFIPTSFFNTHILRSLRIQNLFVVWGFFLEIFILFHLYFLLLNYRIFEIYKKCYKNENNNNCKWLTRKQKKINVVRRKKEWFIKGDRQSARHTDKDFWTGMTKKWWFGTFLRAQK